MGANRLYVLWAFWYLFTRTVNAWRLFLKSERFCSTDKGSSFVLLFIPSPSALSFYYCYFCFASNGETMAWFSKFVELRKANEVQANLLNEKFSCKLLSLKACLCLITLASSNGSNFANGQENAQPSPGKQKSEALVRHYDGQNLKLEKPFPESQMSKYYEVRLSLEV